MNAVMGRINGYDILHPDIPGKIDLHAPPIRGFLDIPQKNDSATAYRYILHVFAEHGADHHGASCKIHGFAGGDWQKPVLQPVKARAEIKH
ncbi:hypothetical protein D3C81_2110470 [compost metagenome]